MLPRGAFLLRLFLQGCVRLRQDPLAPGQEAGEVLPATAARPLAQGGPPVQHRPVLRGKAGVQGVAR